MVRVDVFECASAGDAREKALWMLGEFESPLIEPTSGIGDLAFASRGDALLLFVRANLVYLLRSIGPVRSETRSAARALDTAVVSTPESRRRAVSPIAPDRAPSASPGGSAPDATIEATVGAAAADDPAGPVSRKFVAPEGEFVQRGDVIVYRGPQAGLDRLAAYEWP